MNPKGIRTMEKIEEKQEKLEKTIVEFFPDTKAVIIYGSNGNDYIQGISDVDVIVIGPENDKVGDILETLHKNRPELDPIYISENSLIESKFKGRALGREYELHKFDLYRVKKLGKLLFGDNSILDLFPEINLEDALLDTLPHIKSNFIPGLREKLNKKDDQENLLTGSVDIILVIVRAIYSIETKQYGSKITALEYLQKRYPGFTELLEYIKKIYLRQNAQYDEVLVNEARLFLDFAEKEVEVYLKGTNQS